MPLLIGTTILLMTHPPTRRRLFPSAPLALHNTSSGELQTPQAGYLGSVDSLTGAGEAYKGLAAEQEANSFVTGLASIVVGSVTGHGVPSAPGSIESELLEVQDPRSETASSFVGEIEQSLPSSTPFILGAATAQATTLGEPAGYDKTKKPVEAAMWAAAGPFMHALNVVADMWERFAKLILTYTYRS